MLFGVDDSEALRAEQRLRDHKLALVEAKRALTEQCRAVGQTPERRRAGSVLGAILRSLWAPVFKGVTAVAVERALHRHRDDAAPASGRHDPGEGMVA